MLNKRKESFAHLQKAATGCIFLTSLNLYKMKLILVILLVFITTSLFAQGELPTQNGRVVYELIDSSITATAADLYTKAKLWFANSFNDSKSVIQIDDAENNSILGKGNFQFTQALETYVVKFTVKVDTKDNKYRAQFYDITIEIGTRKKDNAETWNAKQGNHSPLRD